ncbi:MAG: NAD(P)/FAD-dependent oxidoreductase [Clostridia bacterium]
MQYDLIVIGGGPGGYAAALDAAKRGLRTALVERDRLGGTCLQRGCVPTKAYLHDAGADANRRAMYERKNELVAKLTDGIAQLLKAGKIAVYTGVGTLLTTQAPFHVRVTSASTDDAPTLEAAHVLLATGSGPARLPVPGCADPNVWTSDELLGEPGMEDFQALCIIGGGVIGVEMACIYARMGVRVTIVEAERNCLPMLDKELSRSAEALLRSMGITLLTGARLQGIAPADAGYAVTVEKDGLQTLVCDRVLLATGRKPMTDGLFGEGVAPAMERGALVTDADYQTSIPGVYAIGDVNGICPLAHAAHAQGLCAVAHLLGEEPPVNPLLIPSCVYTTPEIASVGITQDEAKARGLAVTVGKALTTQNARTLIEGIGRGFIKLVFDKESMRLLGAQLFCGRASDLVGELALAIEAGLTARQLRRVVRAHPSFYEAIAEAIPE